jgi:hypothetical protein
MKALSIALFLLTKLVFTEEAREPEPKKSITFYVLGDFGTREPKDRA